MCGRRAVPPHPTQRRGDQRAAACTAGPLKRQREPTLNQVGVFCVDSGPQLLWWSPCEGRLRRRFTHTRVSVGWCAAANRHKCAGFNRRHTHTIILQARRSSRRTAADGSYPASATPGVGHSCLPQLCSRRRRARGRARCGSRCGF